MELSECSFKNEFPKFRNQHQMPRNPLILNRHHDLRVAYRTPNVYNYRIWHKQKNLMPNEPWKERSCEKKGVDSVSHNSDERKAILNANS
jgi:hypothetical protein